MIERFQIQEWIRQDRDSVLYHAIDLETGSPVALRRFFPFGVRGGGLDAEEQCAYQQALDRLCAVEHPAWRKVIAGACDPVDGIPFLVNEWIEGTPLSHWLENESLACEFVVECLLEAIDLSRILSQIMGHDAVWVDANPDTLIVGSDSSERRVTFWICPTRWLSANEPPGSLEPLLCLAEKLTGWEGRMLSDSAGQGLGAWLKWLRKHAESTTLDEARSQLEMLFSATPTTPIALTHPAPSPSSAHPILSQPKPRRGIWVAALLVASIAVSVGAWHHLTQDRATNKPAQVTTSPANQLEAQSVNQRAIELNQQAADNWQDGIFQFDQTEKLLNSINQLASIEGKVTEVTSSNSGKTHYLRFSSNPTKNEARIAVPFQPNNPLTHPDTLESFCGRSIRVTGKIRREGTRPQIKVKDANDILIID